MKAILTILLGMIIIACSPKPELPEASEKEQMDVEKELQAIESTRSGFELAIKEGRYDDLRYYAHPDIKAIGPGHPQWAEMYGLRKDRGMFPYDSIVMTPTETVIMNDSMAYDFGTSITYTTDANDSVVVLRDTFLVLLRKDTTGEWKLFREVASAKLLKE